MPELQCWYYDKKDLKNTPSFQHGIDPETEARYRQEGALFIISTGTLMGLRSDTKATGVVYFHRFYMFHSFKDFPRYVTACCCLFLAGKVEETPKKCRNIIETARSQLTADQFLQFGQDPMEEVMTLEKILLQTIKFDFQVEHPYGYLVKYAKRLKGDEQKLTEMVQKAWTFINDSLCTTLSLQWESEIIAIALMHLGGEKSKFTVEDWHGRTPKHTKWWDMFVEDISMDLIDDICRQVLDLYTNTPGGRIGAIKPESPSKTPPIKAAKPPLPQPAPTQRLEPSTTPPLPPPSVVPVLKRNLASNQSQSAVQQEIKRIKLNPPVPAEVIQPQPPLPPPIVLPPEPKPFAPPAETYAQYYAPPPSFQVPAFRYPPPDAMQQPFAAHPHFQGHYPGNYTNPAYQNYQQYYYNVPQQQPAYPGYPVYPPTNDYQPMAAMPPQVYGFPPNPNYQMQDQYPPMNQYGNRQTRPT